MRRWEGRGRDIEVYEAMGRRAREGKTHIYTICSISIQSLACVAIENANKYNEDICD